MPDLIDYLYKYRTPPPSDIMEPGDRRVHWLLIAVDGTSRHEAWYVHCTLGGTSSPNQLCSWWLVGGSEKWETLYAASQEIDFDDELRKAATVGFRDEGGNHRPSFLFCVHKGKLRCSWGAAKSGRQNCLEPRCAEAACKTAPSALLPFG